MQHHSQDPGYSASPKPEIRIAPAPMMCSRLWRCIIEQGNMILFDIKNKYCKLTSHYRLIHNIYTPRLLKIGEGFEFMIDSVFINKLTYQLKTRKYGIESYRANEAFPSSFLCN
ncbi:hypothetical protein BpHYR1_040041 [Brachionus plicatilis]|uniref:Uncharacterized protein n=1 Tax=Brachionus plicatilis TaxID=10195 RepID=A0A3M7R4Y3_BRAPC|nr:hypothetical protein BpHYR1_040041 [Brachionus plicatilis]